MITLDHVGFAVADYERSKAFYEKALAPLGMTLLMEFSGAAAGCSRLLARSSRCGLTPHPAAPHHPASLSGRARTQR